MYASFIGSFIEKTSVMQDQTQSVFKISDETYPPVEASGCQEQNYVRSARHFWEVQLRRQLTVRCTTQ